MILRNNKVQNMINPLVSVIIPSYNREKLILKAINSVLSQTFRDFEILVIDDASTDNTEQVIKDLPNDKIHYYKLNRNGGQCIARNFGMGKARGKFIAFLDSDDEWLPEKLDLQISCFRQGSEKLGCVYGYAYQKDVIKNKTALANINFIRGDIHDKFLEGFCPPTPSLFVIKKEALEKVGGFDENLITFVDLDLWLRLSKHYHFDYVEKPLIIKYEQIGDQYINNFEKRYKGYHLFIKKWHDKVKSQMGLKGLLNFKRSLVYKLVIPFLEHPQEKLRKDIMKLIGLLINVRSKRWRLYIKSFVILLFGPRAIYYIRKRIIKKATA